MPTADLRSDTLTRPTRAMREAMVAESVLVGDDVYGEDPTVAVLEQRVAGLLGHEAGLFTPTGTMAGQLAVRHHVQPGQELLSDELAHVLRAEMGAAAVLSGITSRSWHAPRGLLDPEQPARMMAPQAGPYLVSTACVVLENTHNFGGGTVQPLEAMQQVARLARERGVAVHLDGARLWHAHVATGVALSDYGACADTVSVCLSKGLGAPVGSVLVGSAEMVSQARVWRKRFGGGMRQVGLLAAAGLHALDHHVQRLAEDHARAAQAARAVHDARPEVVDPDHVPTNILVLDVGAVGWRAPDFVAVAAQRGVLGFATGPSQVRLVWHLDVTQEQSDHAAGVLAEMVREGPT
ncbi:threonine aldolase family protein [Ornithinimicrobium sediminis]|uniref:threonine aldolase family protein n=1 Tax=Ornithinimicrobium sediminis TaxID=2904603 RepID=UPI001E3495BC|nr:GntG family PLP-dependent aldolase [Ornithinimicrobium sediminis]MCE0488016.1 aminotransferase class I/II-fold pyridoxal phosphate-dependent enzyme [Ornithinimicrobium sediminis]